jgi:hypothetical protein
MDARKHAELLETCRVSAETARELVRELIAANERFRETIRVARSSLAESRAILQSAVAASKSPPLMAQPRSPRSRSV